MMGDPVSDPIDDLKCKLIACHIDRAMSSCLEIMSELMYMRTVDPETDSGRQCLAGGVGEIVDMNSSMIHELRELNSLI